MNYSQLKKIAMERYPETDTCYDCGGVLHFLNANSDVKGSSVAINKETGECMPFVMAIELDLVDEANKLDFETGKQLV